MTQERHQISCACHCLTKAHSLVDADDTGTPPKLVCVPLSDQSAFIPRSIGMTQADDTGGLASQDVDLSLPRARAAHKHAGFPA